jgi:uncharacterized RDD family membrane protein YckC
MLDEQVSVRSITGVDLTFHVAGPGSRSYAFVVDWHIRLLMSSAWLLISIYLLKLSISPRSHDALLTSLPAGIIYFLYHPVLEIALRGSTPGKRMAGIRILARDGGAPTTMALIIRNIFRLIDSLPVFYTIGLVTCFVTANRVRIGDMAAGTLVIIDQSAAAQALARLEMVAGKSQLPLESLELVDQILERWNELQSAKRTAIARSLLSRIDPATDPTEITALSEAQLHRRLEEFLKLGSSTRV